MIRALRSPRRTLTRASLLAVLASALAPLAAQASTLVVDDDRAQCPDAGYTSLERAIEFAQSHDTIRICPGTYVVGPTAGALPQNGLKIEKSLTIIGAGASKVTIEPGGPLESTAPDVRGNLGNIIDVQNTAPGSTSNVDVNVAISGVTIKDNGNMVNAGVAFHDAVGSVTASQVGPFTASPSPKAGWGIVASNSEAVTPFGAFERNITVSGDLITGYGAGGVLIDGSDSSIYATTKAPYPAYFRSGIATTATITNNVITGSGKTETPSQVGVQVNAGARATITGNQITGNLGATPGSAESPGSGVGILLTDADDTTNVPGSTTSFYTSIGSNDLTGNGYGIFNGTADFPPLHEIFVNGTGFTPTSAQLPESLTNTAMSTTTTPVIVSYDVPGFLLHGATPKANWYGAEKPILGGPSVGAVDGVSETKSTTEDSVLVGAAVKVPYVAPTAPAAIADLPPTAAWGTPAAEEGLVAGQPDELLALAGDDFGVKSVDVTVGETDLGTIESAPYEATWTPPTAMIGQSVILTATVTDEAGQTTVASEEVPVIAAPVIPAHEEISSSTPTTTVLSTPPASIAAAPSISLPASFVKSALHSLVLTPQIASSAGVVGVEYLLDNRTICKVSTAPFTCDYLPTGADVGLHTLKVIVTDAGGQTSQLSATVRFARFTARGLTLHATRSGSALKVSGKLLLPARVTTHEGCARNTVRLTFTSGHRTVRASGTLSSKCAFALTLSHAAGAGRLVASVLGNSVLAPLVHAAKVR